MKHDRECVDGVATHPLRIKKILHRANERAPTPEPSEQRMSQVGATWRANERAEVGFDEIGPWRLS